jgi:hypothetical protein
MGKRRGSYATYEAAEAAGMTIKKDYPMLEVAVYDSVESVHKIIASSEESVGGRARRMRMMWPQV